MGNYYYLAASLPPLDFPHKADVSFATLQDSFVLNLSKEDQEKVRLLRLFVDLCNIRPLLQEEGIDRLVVGVPRPFGDQAGETPQGESVQRFIERLKEKGLIVEEANEVLSSRMAMHHTHELGQKRKRDDLAATIILQSWLDVSKEE